MVSIKFPEIVAAAGLPKEQATEIYKVAYPELVNAGCKVQIGLVWNSIMGESKEMMAQIVKEAWNEKLEADAARLAWENRSPEEKAAYERELASILITSGYNFEGYKITKYSGYVSGDDAVSVDRGFDGWTSTGGSTGDNLLKSLSVIRQRALRELREAALALDCNAVIGVDFDYITLDPQTANSSGGTTYYPYVFCVTANGTAVNIEKE